MSLQIGDTVRLAPASPELDDLDGAVGTIEAAPSGFLEGAFIVRLPNGTTVGIGGSCIYPWPKQEGER